jgi:hypothetical protein
MGSAAFRPGNRRIQASAAVNHDLDVRPHHRDNANRSNMPRPLPLWTIGSSLETPGAAIGAVAL